MAFRSSVRVEFGLPDGAPGGWFTTADLDAPFDDFRIGADGLLFREIMRPDGETEVPPATDLPTAGRLLAGLRWVRAGEARVAHTGFVSLRDGERRFCVRLEDGAVTGVKAGGLEAWAVEGDPQGALELLRLAFSDGRAPSRAEVAAFLDRALGVAR